jgi:guanylate kinase
VIGPSGAGKSTLAGAFVASHPSFQLVLTHTTRPPRPGEAGTHVFVSDQDFDRTPYLGSLSLFGARYGLPPIADPASTVVLLRLAALDQLAGLFPDARIIQVEAPADILVQRLCQRGDPQRADRRALRQETLAGRAAAQAVVRTDQPFDQALTDFARLVSGA